MNLLQKIKSISKIQILAIVLLVVGVAVMIPRGVGMYNNYRESEYARQNNFIDGNPSLDLIRPWMSIRYVAVAYGVPQKYLMETLEIPVRIETSMMSLDRLNAHMHMQTSDGQLEIIDKLREAIRSYRANPVATGLLEGHIQDWMTVQYIANSTGVPTETICKEIGIPMEKNAFLPLRYLGNAVDYPGGWKALARDIEKAVDAHKVQQP